MRTLSIIALTVGVLAVSVANAQTPMRLRAMGTDGKWPKLLWLKGDWKDNKANEVYRKLRIPIDKIPARNRNVNAKEIKAKMETYWSNFLVKSTYESFFPYLYLCAKYPRLVDVNRVPHISRYLLEYYSPDCYEYARAAFIATVGIWNGDSSNFPDGFDKRFRKYAKDDWLLTETLINLYAGSSRYSKADREWGWAEAKRLADTMPDGTYGFGRLRIDAAMPLVLKDFKFLDQEVAYLDKLITGNYFNKQDIERLKDVKAFILAGKKRVEDFRRKNGGG